MSIESYPATDIDVYDGDTVRCRVRMTKRIKMAVEITTSIMGINIELESAEIVLKGTAPVSVRISGVDTPEMRGLQKAAGEIVKAAVIDWFAAKGPVIIEYDCRDKYAGRTVGDFRPTAGGETLSEFLVRNKLAKRYDGGTKDEWTRDQLAAIAARGNP